MGWEGVGFSSLKRRLKIGVGRSEEMNMVEKQAWQIHGRVLCVIGDECILRRLKTRGCTEVMNVVEERA